MDFQQSTRTVRVFQFELTEAEALNVCANPDDFTHGLRSALANGDGHADKQNGGGKRPSHVKKAHKSNALEKVKCPHCTAMVARKYIPNHIRVRHPEHAPQATAD